MRNIRRHIISWVLMVIMLLPVSAYATYCIPAGDFGTGGVVTVYANPARDANTPLLRDTPVSEQIAPWIDTGLFVSDQAINAQAGIKGYVEGAWYPWGKDPNTPVPPECEFKGCRSGVDADAICIDGQKIQGRGIRCQSSQGYGLYGLIALTEGGANVDPNQLENATTLSPTMFRTFLIAPLKSLKDGTKYFEMDHTYYYNTDTQGDVQTVTDKQGGSPSLKNGRLYLKIVDNYYGDNEGGYTVTLVGGVYTKEGFVATTIKMVTSIISNVQKTMYISIVENTKFVQIIKAMLLLYVVFSALLFMMGMLRAHKAELVIRIFKVGFIGTLISKESWDFFNTYVFNFFLQGGQTIADVIIRSTVYTNSDPTQPVFLMPDVGENGSLAISVYDLILKMLISEPFHNKIWALLFTERCYFIPVIYICVVFMLLAILKSVLIYLLAVINMALLLVIGPFFIAMVLFSFTRNLFDDWLKQLIATAMMIIFLSATLALMVKLILGNIQQMLFYKVCWDTVVTNGTPWKLVIAGTTIFDIKFWQIADPSQVLAALTFFNLVSFLITAILFYAFIEQVPAIVDTLSGAARRPMSELYGGALQQWQQSRFGKLLDKAMAEPSARIGAQRELVVERAEGAISRKLEDLGAPKMAAGIAGSAVKSIAGMANMPAGLYRAGQGFARAVEASDTSPNLFTGSESTSFVDVDKLKKKPEKPKFKITDKDSSDDD